METVPKRLMIVAGEASGDMHAAHLVNAIKQLDPAVTFSGLGGAKMQESGVSIYEDLTELAVVGFVEVLKHYGTIKKLFNLFLKKADEIKPAAVILVDYPGFNLRLARALKKKGIKVIYYISPQVWAWKASRVKQIQKDVDKMLVLFEFEKEFYAKHGVEVDFVGHPLIDSIKIDAPKEQFRQRIGLSPSHYTVGLLPGSREEEIQRILPVMLEAAAILHKKIPNMQFLVLKAPSIDLSYLNGFLEGNPLPIKVVGDRIRYNGLNACEICMVTSGTATLETAILEKPMIIVYKTSFITYLLAKLFVKIPHIGLVNVVAGKKVVPECIQSKAKGKTIADEMYQIFFDEIKIVEMKTELQKVKNSLGEPGASLRAAQAVLGSL